MDHSYRFLLPQPMNPSDALLQYRRVLGLIHIDNHRGMLEIQTYAPGIRRQKNFTRGILPKLFDQIFPLTPGHTPMEENMSPFFSFESSHENLMSAHPLAENNHLGFRFLKDFIEESCYLIRLHPIIRLLVQQVGPHGLTPVAPKTPDSK